MRGLLPLLWCVLVVAAAGVQTAAQRPTRQQLERVEETERREGEAIVALADAALNGDRTPSDFPIRWHNDFLKAQQGTFIPFILTIDGPGIEAPALLVYLRAVARPAAESDARGYPFEDVYPIDGRNGTPEPLRIVRGFSLAPGEYDLYIVARERVDPAQPELRRKASVVKHALQVPDFSSDALTTSSVILADGLTALAEPPRPEALQERPYLIGLSEIQPAVDSRFGKDEELIVVFLVYNPSVTLEKKFDIEVEYHFFRQSAERGGGEAPRGAMAGRPLARDGEAYFNHTRPQRLTPAIMGPGFDPAAGQPVMAGQGVPLAAFPEGDYRLAITVTDRLSGRSITRDVRFTVVPAPGNGA